MKNLKLLILIMVVVTLGMAQNAQAVVLHGIGTAKGTEPSLVSIGDEYCSVYRIQNDQDDANDTIVIIDVCDVIHASGGDVPSGNIIEVVTWTFNGGATQDGGTGDITLPPGASVDNEANPYCSGYFVTEADFFLDVSHVLQDTVTVIWFDTCFCSADANSDPNCTGEEDPGCATNDRFATEIAQVLIEPPDICIEVRKFVDCDVSKVGDKVSYTFEIENCSVDDVNLTREWIYDTVLGDLNSPADANGCDVLEPGEICTFWVEFTIPEDACNPLENIVEVNYVDAFDQTVGDLDNVFVDLVHPDFEVTKSCQTGILSPGGSAIFDVNVINTGDVTLCFTTNDPCIGPFTLDPGEEFGTTVAVPFDGNDILNSIEVTAVIGSIDGNTCAMDDEECLPNEIVKEANDICIGECATRTPGFWKTHTDYTTHVFNVHIPECLGQDCIDLGWTQLCDVNDVFGIFWANRAHNTDDTRRDKLCQLRIRASFHAVAAILNHCLDNGCALPGDLDPEEIASILGGENKGAIRTLAGQLGDYNGSNDDKEIMDDDVVTIGNADPPTAKANADYENADCTANDKPPKGHGKP